jgi:hypothetical protein
LAAAGGFAIHSNSRLIGLAKGLFFLTTPSAEQRELAKIYARPLDGQKSRMVGHAPKRRLRNSEFTVSALSPL